MSTQIEKMNRCMNPEMSLEDVIALLQDADWHVTMVAAVALGDRADAKAVPAFLALLQREDEAPLFSQTEDYSSAPAGATFTKGPQLPANTPHETAMAWERRGRLKQSIIWSLAAIGVSDMALLKKLQGYAVDQKQDYMVRAASCRALGILKDSSSRAALEQATNDAEWCTMTEAKKALAKVS